MAKTKKALVTFVKPDGRLDRNRRVGPGNYFNIQDLGLTDPTPGNGTRVNFDFGFPDQTTTWTVVNAGEAQRPGLGYDSIITLKPAH